MSLPGVASDLTAEDLAPEGEESVNVDAPNEAIDNFDLPAQEASESPADEVEASPEAESDAEVDAEAAEQDAEAEAALSPDEQKKLGQKAQNRIRALADQNNVLREEMASLRAESSRSMAALQRHFQEQLAEQAAQREELSRYLRDQADASRSAREREEYERLPLSERIKRDAIREARQGQAERGEIEQLRKELADERQAREQFVDGLKKQQRLAALGREVDESTNGLLNGLDVSKWSSEDKQLFGEMFMGYAGGTGKRPTQAATDFKRVMDKYALARMNALGAQNKQRVQAGKNVPPVTPGRGAKGAATGAAAVKQKLELPKNMKHRDPESMFDEFVNQLSKQS